MADLTPRQRMLLAARREPVDGPPVWLMRQAGRYLPEYRALKEGRDFWTLVRTPDLAAEITLQPVRRFGMDAAILFSDILVVPDAMGAEVGWGEKGPEIGRLVRSRADVVALPSVDAGRDLAFMADAIAMVRAALPDHAVIGFAGGPLTLAAYMIEGRVSEDLRGVRDLASSDPAALDSLLASLTDAVLAALALQVEAGADLVQVFDTWAGRLSPGEYDRWALPWTRAIAERLRASGVPVILYVKGAARLIERMEATGADVLSVDSGLPMDEAVRRTGGRVAIQGNLDPSILFGPAPAIREAVRWIVGRASPASLILNLGHGVLPGTPVEGVAAFVEAAREARS